MVNEKTVTIPELKKKIKLMGGKGYSKLNRKQLIKLYKELSNQKMKEYDESQKAKTTEFGAIDLIQAVKNKDHIPVTNTSRVKFNPLTENSLDKIITEFIEVYTSKRGFYGYLNDSIILSPNRVGRLGTNTINKMVQNKLYENKHDIYIDYFGKRFYEGDRIIQTKNNQALNVFNGNIGFIKNIVSSNGDVKIRVLFEDKEIFFKESDLENVELAYAITIHKSQGGEWNDVFMIIAPEHKRLLSNQLIYTAVSRVAKNILTIEADMEAWTYGIHKSVLNYITYSDVVKLPQVTTESNTKTKSTKDKYIELPF